MICPCCSSKSYADCCQPYLQGQQHPETPLALMRSRYTAYTQADIGYIQRTMQGPALQGFDPESSRRWASQIQWLKLIIVDAAGEFVEFMAFFSENGKQHLIHERSEFKKIAGQWFYIQGRTPKTNRNAPCPCGSSKKFKHCCQS